MNSLKLEFFQKRRPCLEISKARAGLSASEPARRLRTHTRIHTCAHTITLTCTYIYTLTNTHIIIITLTHKYTHNHTYKHTHINPTQIHTLTWTHTQNTPIPFTHTPSRCTLTRHSHRHTPQIYSHSRRHVSTLTNILYTRTRTFTPTTRTHIHTDTQAHICECRSNTCCTLSQGTSHVHSTHRPSGQGSLWAGRGPRKHPKVCVPVEGPKEECLAPGVCREGRETCSIHQPRWTFSLVPGLTGRQPGSKLTSALTPQKEANRKISSHSVKCSTGTGTEV